MNNSAESVIYDRVSFIRNNIVAKLLSVCELLNIVNEEYESDGVDFRELFFKNKQVFILCTTGILLKSLLGFLIAIINFS